MSDSMNHSLKHDCGMKLDDKETEILKEFEFV